MVQFLAGQRVYRLRGLVGGEAGDVSGDYDLGIGGAAGLHEAGIGHGRGFGGRRRFGRKGDMRNSRRNRGGQEESSKLHKNPFLIWKRAVYATLSHITTLPRDFIYLSLPHPSRRAAFVHSFENSQLRLFPNPPL